MAHLPRRRTCCRATNLDMDFFVVHDAETRQRSTSLPPELSLIVTDTLACSATFVLTTFLCRTLREPKRPIVLVSLSQTLSRYTAICRKAGVQLDNALVRPRFRFVDGLNVLASPVQDSESDGHVLQALHSSIADALAVLLNPRPPTPSRPAASADPFPPVAADVPGVTTPVIIVDDLTALLWSGAASASSLKTFYRSLQLLVKPHRGTLLSLVHADTTFAHSSASPDAADVIDHTDDAVLRDLVRASGIWIQTRALGSQTVGELVVHRAPGLGDRLPGLQTGTRATPTQFKLEDTGARFFAKGAAREYL